MVSEYILYLLRWQSSSPILWLCYKYLPFKSDLTKTVTANLIGGLIFFWVDILIFKKLEEVKTFLSQIFH